MRATKAPPGPPRIPKSSSFNNSFLHFAFDVDCGLHFCEVMDRVGYPVSNPEASLGKRSTGKSRVIILCDEAHVMTKIGKMQVAISGLRDALISVIGDWQPPPLKTELEYRDALYKRLREALPEDARLEKEYRHTGTTADLYLRWKGLLSGEEVFFELKRNLKRKVEFDRLVGQIQDLGPERHNIVIVLAGELDSSLVARLKDRYNRFLNPTFFESAWMALIKVS